jgi:hypothetical protein
MRLVILESPYAGGSDEEIAQNVTFARAALRHCLMKGEAPIASHLLYTQLGVLYDGIPQEREMGIAAGLEWARVAEAAVFYADRGWSPGMLAAFEAHMLRGLHCEQRWLRPIYEVFDAIGLARQRFNDQMALRAICDKHGMEMPW